MAAVVKNRKKKNVIDKAKLLDRLQEIISCDDLEIIKIALQGLIEEIEDA
jgi:hypothetical protein